MLRKFESIKNLGVFPNYKWDANVHQLESFNLIYGWNGTGKTTLSRLLRFLENNEHLPDEWQPEFNIISDAGMCTHANPAALSNSICVFNTDFVESNIQWAQGKTNKLLIGKASQELSEKLNLDRKTLKLKETEIAKAQSEKAKSEKRIAEFLTKRASEIKTRLSTSLADGYKNYNKGSFTKALASIKDVDVTALKLSPEDEQKLNAEIQQPAKEQILPIAIQAEISVILLNEATGILQKTPASSFIDKLRKDPDLNAWVKRGYDIHRERKEAECQFCLQEIPAARFENLNKHFSDEYTNFIAEIDRIGKAIKALVDKYQVINLVSSKDVDQEYQDAYSAAQQEFYQLRTSWKDLLDSALSELRRKRENPFEEIISTKILDIVDFEKKIVSSLNKVNSVIKEHNDKSSNIGSYIAAAKLRIEKSMVAKLQKESVDLDKELSIVEGNIKNLSAEYNTLYVEIESLLQKVVDTKIGETEVNKDLHRFLGRDDIRLKDDEDGGYSILRNGKKAKYLSEGEKTAIALIYFFSKIREGSPLGEKTIVIDDPISSLDSQSTHYALSFIKDRISNAKQVIFFTHNFYCLKEVKGWKGKRGYNKTDFKTYMLTCSVDGSPLVRTSKIEPLDPLLEKFDSEYHYLFSKLYGWTNSNDDAQTLEQMYPLANMARRVLETFLSFKVPHHGGSYEQMKHLNGVDDAEKNRLIRFLDVMSHSDSPDRIREFPPSSVEEMGNVIVSLLKIMETADKDHFNGMKSVVDAQNISLKAKVAA